MMVPTLLLIPAPVLWGGQEQSVRQVGIIRLYVRLIKCSLDLIIFCAQPLTVVILVSPQMVDALSSNLHCSESLRVCVCVLMH